LISIIVDSRKTCRLLTPKIALRPWRKAHENAAFDAGLAGLMMLRSRDPPAK
jgi:hypothetical protein